MIVADSDILIDALRGRDPGASRVAQEIRNGALATTAVTVFELLSGAKDRVERSKVERLLGALPILSLDDHSGVAAADVRLQLERAGLQIGMADYLIAGVCVARSLPLLTRNRDHFERVPGLALTPLTG